MIETIIISILGVLVVVLGFTTFNLLRKNEKQEDILTGYMEYLDQISKTIEFSDEKIKKIDSQGIFKSDDEIGFMYEQIKELQRILSNFRIDKLWAHFPLEKERKKQRQEEATKNADTREKPELKFKKKERKILKDAGVDPQKAANELANGSLDSLRKLTEHTQKLRAQGIAGAGGPVASEGESKFTQANNEMKKGSDGKSEHDKFKEKNKKKIQEKKVIIKTTETDIKSLILNSMESLNQRVYLISCKKDMVF